MSHRVGRNTQEPRAGHRPQEDQSWSPATTFAEGRGHRGKGPIGYQRSDERIREDICDALTDHDGVDASGLEVAVKSGEVTLTGAVDDRRSKRLAEDVAESVSGVKDVDNKIRIGKDGTAPDKANRA